MILQNTTQKNKGRARRTPIQWGMNSGAPEGLAVRRNLLFLSYLRLKSSLLIIGVFFPLSIFYNLNTNL